MLSDFERDAWLLLLLLLLLAILFLSLDSTDIIEDATLFGGGFFFSLPIIKKPNFNFMLVSDSLN
jgi:hypothetical protein